MLRERRAHGYCLRSFNGQHRKNHGNLKLRRLSPCYNVIIIRVQICRENHFYKNRQRSNYIQKIFCFSNLITVKV